MFDASQPFGFFDYFRVPYQVAAPGPAGSPVQAAQLRVAGGPARSLFWLAPAVAAQAGRGGCQLGRYQLGDFTFFGQVALNAAVPGLLSQAGQGWRPDQPVTGPDGQAVAAIWRDQDGSVFLPFDPAEIMQNFWSEQWREVGRSALKKLAQVVVLRGYYAVRPALPRPVQLRLRRAFTQVQARASFPAWPVEDSLHEFYAWMFSLLSDFADQPVPYLGLWPDGRSWALVLTHDVETADGYQEMDLLRGPEREHGYRSSWNFVGLRYPVEDEKVRSLKAEGCEVGVHGLRHDGRDLASARLLSQRLPAMREFAERWGAVGFRSPATQRHWDLMPRLGFEYDSSYTDTDPYEPQPGGCCTYLPYFNGPMVELPITLPQDHTLFAILQQPDGETWLRKARHLREREGMALVLTHPDYAGDQRLAGGYRSLLEAFQADATVWHALPREVAQWWRERAASTIRQTPDGWTVAGPAQARGQVRFRPAAGITAGAAGAS